LVYYKRTTKNKRKSPGNQHLVHGLAARGRVWAGWGSSEFGQLPCDPPNRQSIQHVQQSLQPWSAEQQKHQSTHTFFCKWVTQLGLRTRSHNWVI